MTKTFLSLLIAAPLIAAPLFASAASYDYSYNDSSQSRIEVLLRELTRLQSLLSGRNNAALSGCYRAGAIEYCYDEDRYSTSRGDDRYEYTSYGYDDEYRYDDYRDYDNRYYSDSYYEEYDDYYYDDSDYYEDEYRDEDRRRSNYYEDDRRDDRGSSRSSIESIEVSFANDRAYVWVHSTNGRQQNFVYRTQNERSVISQIADELGMSERSVESMIDWEYRYAS